MINFPSDPFERPVLVQKGRLLEGRLKCPDEMHSVFEVSHFNIISQVEIVILGLFSASFYALIACKD